jgi:hypothetical protein
MKRSKKAGGRGYDPRPRCGDDASVCNLNAATERVIYLEQTHIETLMMVAEKEDP